MAVSRSQWGRRGFLQLSGAAAAAGVLAACGTRTAPGSAGQLVGPDSPRVGALEAARRDGGGRLVPVSLRARPLQLDLAGTTVSTWGYGDQVPGPAIRVRKGEVLRVSVANGLPAPTTVHWHGIALRNDMDGVPDLTQTQIGAGGAFTYEFAVAHAGTYWFHPHVGTQLDRGLYAPLIVEDPSERADYDAELVVVLDDWIDGTGTDPDKVLAGLQDKGMPGMDHSMGPMGGMSGGMPMGGMGVNAGAPLGADGGDVTYPHYLVNGRVAADPQSVDYRPGTRVRLRIINAGGDSAFRVAIPGSPLTVTHTDGFPVQPQQADALLIGMGERIDAVVTIGDASVPLLAAPYGKDGYAQLLLRSGGKPVVGSAQNAAAAMKNMTVLDTATSRATDGVALAPREPDISYDLRLAGPGEKYTWTINEKTYNPSQGLPVQEGQRVRLRYINNSMMFHPMHLHGHTFAVRSPGGAYTARKDTVLVAPMATVEVDFDADNPGQWLTHCHNIYHGEAGMMTVISYRQ
ncbi:multicopper oxidase family protein [Mycobacteroides abscessus]|nr:multicopper oxidase family protein [Mycobacteroides abscessus]SHQ35533.1 Probable oxidase (copper-binding protein) [Mycobacteroides abscessus subsp. abscessus]SHQ38478.1 Probable oxidase (copper-binding protein) [Mycobacteroides abscessus subsp. abscessus]SHQ51058.1 Probable oxidase (copper-binding protein) [Mycobacteroides abscessus subsp. abscessus]SHQ54944.1 Probable oxidase (copper-binding protein) [Mycobacteroides abscessus subsp. abscessus]SHR30233.1 Probable oxidase (copper-binding p